MSKPKVQASDVIVSRLLNTFMIKERNHGVLSFNYVGEFNMGLKHGLIVLSTSLGGIIGIGLFVLWSVPTFDCYSLSGGEFNSHEIYEILTILCNEAQLWLHVN